MGQPTPGYGCPGGMKFFPAAIEHFNQRVPQGTGSRPGTPGPTINRSGTQNYQWLTTVYDYGREWSLVK